MGVSVCACACVPVYDGLIPPIVFYSNELCPNKSSMAT